MHYTLKYSLLAGLIFTTSTQAEEAFRQHEAHEHGHVEFNIAQDGNELLVEITAPGSDVVGFEHPPENESQHERIENAEKVLNTPMTALLLSPSAECKPEHIEVRNSLENHQDHDEEGHDEHGHESDHDAKGHNEHEHESDHDAEGHDEHEHENDSHGAFTIEYHFECNNISKLNSIETKWFELFPNTEEISVNILTDTYQNALELTKDNRVIKF